MQTDSFKIIEQKINEVFQELNFSVDSYEYSKMGKDGYELMDANGQEIDTNSDKFLFFIPCLAYKFKGGVKLVDPIKVGLRFQRDGVTLNDFSYIFMFDKTHSVLEVCKLLREIIKKKEIRNSDKTKMDPTFIQKNLYFYIEEYNDQRYCNLETLKIQ